MEAYQELEREWAEWCDLDPAGMCVCSSGTAALHLACECLELPPGSQVVCPDLTMVACPRAIVLAGLTPVFVDCGDDLNMDMENMTQASYFREVDDPQRFLANPLSAIMAVHVYGRRCNMDYISEAADNWNAKVIEDLAEAHGVKPHPQTNAACWSFFSNKIVAGQEGGAVWFKEPKHAALARQLRSLGFTEAHDYEHIPRGHNYRMSNAHAQLIRYSLQVVDANISKRWEWWFEHDARCPAEWKLDRPDAPWVFAFRVLGMERERQNALVQALNEAGVKARHCFKAMSAQAEFRDCKVVGNGKAAELSEQVIYLPLSPEPISGEKVDEVWGIVHKVLS